MFSFSPKSGADKVAPDAKVTVAASGGTLSEVRVTDTDGHELPGVMAADRRGWHATSPVRVDSHYEVHAWGTWADGKDSDGTATFATRDVHRSGTLQVSMILPHDGSTVGVAQPLVVAFDRPVANQKLVQKALTVTTVPHVAGAWFWIDDSQVHFRPAKFWPTGTKVTLHVGIAEVSAGAGVVGGTSRTSTFTVGRNQVLKVNTDTHKLRVLRNGHKVKSFDVTTGRPGWETRNGTEVMIDKLGKKHWTNEAIDAPESYSLHSQYAIRITNSGEFVHDAPWATGTIGDANTSHGCVGLGTADMKWIWDNSLVGDPVVITGSDRSGQNLWNIYDDWNVPWSTWAKGNADRPA
jgi:lipoprotein-anchoring transpeptidase ErfK/SrfK